MNFLEYLFIVQIIFVFQNLIFLLTAAAIFERWGRTDCPGNNTELVYSGNYRGLRIA